MLDAPAFALAMKRTSTATERVKRGRGTFMYASTATEPAALNPGVAPKNRNATEHAQQRKQKEAAAATAAAVNSTSRLLPQSQVLLQSALEKSIQRDCEVLPHMLPQSRVLLQSTLEKNQPTDKVLKQSRIHLQSPPEKTRPKSCKTLLLNVLTKAMLTFSPIYSTFSFTY